MPTATEPPPPINTKRSRRHGVINITAPDVPPSPPLPPLPPKSPLRARARSSADSTTIAAALPWTPANGTPTQSPTPSNESVTRQSLVLPNRPSLLDVGISSSPLSISSSTFAPPSNASTSTATLPQSPPAVAGPSTTSKRTHALRELLDTERAYASDLALVRDVYIRLARDPMAPFASALPPTTPPVTKPLRNRVRASTGGRPKTATAVPTTPPLSPPTFNSRSPSATNSSSTSLISSLKRKTSSPSLARQAALASPEVPPPRQKHSLSEEDVVAIFLNIETLASLSEDLCKKLEVAVLGESGYLAQGVGTLMLEFIPRMLPHYKIYMSKHPAAAQRLLDLTPQITSYLSTARAIISPHTNAWDLPSLLIKPMQRVLKYPLLLSAIADATPGELPGAIQLREAKRVAEKACTDINEAKRLWEEVGTVLQNARARKLVVSPGGLPSRISLPPVLEVWDKRLEEMEKAIRRLASDSREWSKGFRTAMERLVQWADANERIMRSGTGEGESHDGRGRWCKSAVDEVLGGVWKLTDVRIRTQLLPTLTSLLANVSSPRLLLLALRSSLPESVADPVSTALQGDLPRLMQLASRVYATCVVTFAKWQRDVWEGVRVEWGKALGEEEGEWLEDLEGRLLEETVVVDQALQEQIQLATPNLIRNHFVPFSEVSVEVTEPAALSTSVRPRSMDAADVTAQFYGLHIVQSDETDGKRNGIPRSITFDDIAFSRSSSQAASASSLRQSAETFYTLPSAQSSSSQVLPTMTNGSVLTRSTPSLTRDDGDQSAPPTSFRSSLAASESPDELLAGSLSTEHLHETLKGMPLDEALRSMGMQEFDLADDAQAQWAGLYDERQSVRPEDYRTPPETPDNAQLETTSGVQRKPNGLTRLRSSASTKSLAKLFNRSRSATPDGRRTPPLPTPTPPLVTTKLPWASSYAYAMPQGPVEQAELAHYNFYPMPQRSSDPQPMLGYQPSYKDKVLAHRQHSRQTSNDSASPASNAGSSRRSSASTGQTAVPPPTSFVPPPRPRRVHFLASPITAFHLPTPRYSVTPYTFHGLSFLTLRVGDIITVTQECGRPTDYRDFPLWTDGQEDRLLVARAEDGQEGWVLASFVLPITT